MQSILFAAFLAAAAWAAPAPGDSALNARAWASADGKLQVRGLKYQGDGLYMASFNDAGVAEVAFTPFSELNATAAAEVDLSGSDNDATKQLTKRAGTTCVGKRTPDLAALDEANRMVAVYSDRWYDKHSWGWVFRNNEASYICPYQAQYVPYGLVIDMHTVITNRCGRDAYGFDRRTNGGGANDLALGRINRGNNFCADGFYGF